MLKTKTIKKLVSILSCAALIVGICPFSALAAVKNRENETVFTADFSTALVNGAINDNNISGRNSESWNVFSASTDSGKAVLKASVPAGLVAPGKEAWGMVDWDANIWFLNDGSKFVTMEQGKTYSVTVKYKLASCDKGASELSSKVGGWRNHLTVGYGTNGDSWGTFGNIVPASTAKDIIPSFDKTDLQNGVTDASGNAVTVGTWNTVTVDVTAKADSNDYRLWLCATALTGTEIVISDVAVAEKSISYIDFSKALTEGEIDGSAIAGRTGEWNAYSAMTENGDNMLKISVPSALQAPNGSWGIFDWDTGLWFLNNGNSFVSLKAGTTYTVTVRYKLNSCTKAVSELDKSVNWRRNTLIAGYGTKDAAWYENGNITPESTNVKIIDGFDKPAIDNQTHKDINDNVVKVGQWTTVSFEITPEAGANDYRLWFFTRILTGTEIYVSDVVVAEKAEGMGITFEETSYGIAPSLYNRVAGNDVTGRSESWNVFTLATEADGNKALKASVPASLQGEGKPDWGMVDRDSNLWFVNDGMQYITLQHGKAYNVSLKYKVASCDRSASEMTSSVGGWRNNLTVGYGTNGDSWGTFGNIVPSTATTTELIPKFDKTDLQNGVTDASGNAVTVGTWNTVSVDIIPEAGVNDYRLWLCSTALTGTEILIDDISVTVWDGKRVTVIDLNGSNVKDITSLEDITVPAAEGFTFTGWYSDSDCTVQASYDGLLLDGSKIYAGYSADAAILGDINADGQFSVADLVRAKKLSTQEKVDISTAPELDLNGTGTVSAASAMVSLQKHLLGVKALTAPSSGVYFAGASSKGYRVVLPTELRSVMVTAAAENLASALGVELVAASDSNYQIVIGSEQSGLPAGSYAIRLTGKKVIISAGKSDSEGNDDVLAAAINRLTEFVTKSNGTLLSFKHNINFTCRPSFGSTAYKYTWGDEFNDDTVDRSVWKGFNPSKAVQYAEGDDYQTKNFRDELIYEIGGHLALPLINDTTTKTINGSAISTENTVSFRYGLYETRAKIADPRSGAATAIWLWSFHDKQSCWDATNEIDMLENFARASSYTGDENTAKYGAGTLNYHAATGTSETDRADWTRINSYFNDEQSRYFYTTDKNAPKEWETYHIYSVDWQPERIVWYIDGREIQRLEKSALTAEQKAIVDKAFEAAVYPVFSAGVSGIGSDYSKYKPAKGLEVWNTDILIDYVRLYQNDNGELNIY